MQPARGMRLGLCCTFIATDIKFRATTARFVATKPRRARRLFLGELALHNLASLEAAVAWCAAHGVGAFRIPSQLFPLVTHPELGYHFASLAAGADLVARLDRIRALAARAKVRLSFHPDQFVVPGSASEATVVASLAELEHQAELAEALGAEQLTVHGGGGRPTKREALERLRRGVDRLSERARARLALENDDRVYTVLDLLPVCRELGLPLVYDVHHHRCNPDGLSVVEATRLAARTWGGREPWAHVSSPRGGWRGPAPERHADYIRPRDLPRAWLGKRITVDVEAKAKERAVLRLLRWVRAQERARRA